MGCTKCKKQQQKEYVESQLRSVDKWALLFLVGLGSLAVYGVYSLIRIFI